MKFWKDQVEGGADMRTKEEILKSSKKIDIGGNRTAGLTLEALLDIRDLMGRLASPPMVVEKTASSIYDELLTIDDALNRAGAPPADTRVGRIRKWEEIKHR